MKTRTKVILGVGAALALFLIVRKKMQPTLAQVSKAKASAMATNTITVAP